MMYCHVSALISTTFDSFCIAWFWTSAFFCFFRRLNGNQMKLIFSLALVALVFLGQASATAKGAVGLDSLTFDKVMFFFLIRSVNQRFTNQLFQINSSIFRVVRLLILNRNS